MNKWERFKQGIKDLTTEQQLSAKKTGIIGQIIGLTLGFTVILYKGLWWWAPFLLFTVFLLYVELLAVNKQLRQIRQLQEEIL